MAELKNYVMAVITILFVASAAVSIYSVALTNNIDSGGNASTVSFPLLNQTTAYTTSMNTFSEQMSNSTLAASSTPSSALGSLGGGIGAITQAGTGAISLSFNALTILITMISSIGVSLVPLGVPPMAFAFGILSITIGIVFAILAAVFKWWI